MAPGKSNNMNTAGINRINEFAIIFQVMNELFQKELPSNFDDTLLVGKVMRRLEGRVNPNLIREAVAFIHHGAAQPPSQHWEQRPKEAKANWGDLN